MKENNNTLYHYTAIHGLAGILNSKELWLSKSTVMNDPGEIEYAWKFYKAAIEKYENTKFFEPLIKWIDGILKVQDIFILSLTKEKDSLPLWLRYGKGYGCSIEFDMKQLSIEIRNSNIKGMFKGFYEVSYEEDFNKKYVEEHIEKYYQAQKTNWSYPTDSEQTANLNFRVISSLFAFKHKAYADEKEIRGIFLLPNLNSLVVSSYYHDNISFRTQGDRKIPYIALKFQTLNWIRSVMLGPLNKKEGDIEEINSLFKGKKSEISVIKSEVPYR